MPKDFSDAEVPQAREAMPQDVQNLLTLADALEREHEGFTWAFDCVEFKSDCGTVGCAIGLAGFIGLARVEDRFGEFYTDEDLLQEQLGLTRDQYDGTFHQSATYGFTYEPNASLAKRARAFRQVTPGMVAAELRRIAAEKLGR